MLQGLASAASAALRLAGNINWDLSQFPGLTGSNAPIADPLNTQQSHQLSPSIFSHIEFGVIVDVIAQQQAYRVLPEGEESVIVCTRLRAGSVSPIGVADGSTLSVSTPVYFIRHPKAVDGIIIGAEPIASMDARQLSADEIVQGSNVGIQIEPAFQEPHKLGGPGVNGGIVDCSGRTPMDSVPISDVCFVTETGLMLSLDSYMAAMRVDEMCGLWMFYWDQLLRIAATNFQRWTSGSVLESYDDEGEHLWYQGIAGYPWEQFGMLGQPRVITQKNTPEDSQLKKAWLASTDLIHADAIPFHRLQEYAGYVGQGYKRLMVTPPADATEHRLATELVIPGLFEENVTFSGHYAVRSASGLTIGKRPVIPVPKRVKAPEDQKGDKPDNYKSSGFYGDGPQHKVQPSPDVQATSGHNMSRAAGVQDLHAHIFNWESANGLAYHTNDFFYPDEADDTTIEANQKPVPYNDLKTQYSLEAPDPIVIPVDTRNDGKNAVQVFPNNSYLTFLDDGGIVLGDGFGSEIIMTGGNIRIVAAGDIFLEAGRNVQQWAGNDFIARAKQSADITCTEGDFRVKAEKNMQLIGGNGGGAHGIMLDSRGTADTYNFEHPGERTEHSGIVFRSENAPVVTWARSIYQRSLNRGDIVIDADRGDGEILTHSSFTTRFLKYGAIDAFGIEGEIDAVNYYVEKIAGLSGGLCTTDGIWSGGSHLIDGSYYALGGHIYTEQANENNNKVPTLTEAGLQQLRDALQGCDDNATNIRERSIESYLHDMDFAWYQSGKAGNDTIIDAGEASLRADTDYVTTGFVLYEARWAREARANELSVEIWEEKPVKFGSTDTYPFPGKTKLEADTFIYQAATLHDPKTGLSKPRVDDDGTFTAPVYGEPDPAALNENYPIIGRGASSE